MKNILITSLGASPKPVESSYIVENEKRKGYITSDALRKFYQYDYIIYIGTTKSQWEVLYYSWENDMSDKEKCFNELQNLRNNSNGKTDITKFCQKKEFQDLKEFCAKISDTKISLTVIKYGLDENEIMDNYNILKGKLSEIITQESDSDIDISFDLSGSFRTLPVYQMVFVNYFNSLAHKNVSMNKMYCSMFEAKSEFGDKVPVVNLDNILELSSMVAGVSEFNNTGSMITLTKLLEERQKDKKENDDLIKVFKQFDYATNINDMTMQQESCIKLMEVLDSKIRDNQNNPSGDVYQVLKDSISNQILENIKIENIKNNLNSNYTFQYNISRWYLRQKRYGLAIATGLEALRTMLVIPYLEAIDREVNAENMQNENNRRDSLDLLKKKEKELLHKKENSVLSETEEAIINLEKYRERAKELRNRFAHNLTQPANTGNADGSSVQEGISLVEKYIETLDKVHQALKKDKKLFDVKKNDSKTLKVCQENTYFCFGFQNDIKKNDIKKKYETSNKSKDKTEDKYNVKFIDNVDSKKIEDYVKTGKEYQLGQLICEYFKDIDVSRSEKVSVIFAEGRLKQVLICSTMLRKFFAKKKPTIIVVVYYENMKIGISKMQFPTVDMEQIEHSINKVLGEN